MKPHYFMADRIEIEFNGVAIIERSKYLVSLFNTVINHTEQYT